ncbi:hypothetical protein C8F01DRAFT_251819 [Mycena amicta]|nr:hypothetical protein C8F01DRAFT_251819 [Mycena amicta]
MLELEKEKNYEREHDWNKSHPSRSNSSSSLHPATERTRKLSQPSRPGSSQSIRPPSALRRHSSVSASSSPETSDEEERIHHEIDHERERNWNAPKPKWGSHPHDPHGHQHHRSPSPLPSPAASTSRKERSRVDSLTVRGPPKADSSGHVLGRGSPIASSSKTNHNDTIRPSILKSPVASMSRPRPLSYPARPNSPLPPLQGPSKLPGPSSTHPPSPERERNRSRLPSSPSPVPSKRPAIAANRNSLSHIPVRSRSPTKTPGKAKTNGHSRTVVESPIDRRPVMQDVPQSDAESDKVDEDDGTPVNPPAVLPVESSQRRSPSLRRTVANDEDVKFQQALSVAPPPSPPPSPPTPPPATEVVEPPTMLSLLSTPPKRPSFHNSKMDFKTPSPPRGLPDLPGPPSSSDEETETERVTPPRFADATMKTPRPPGAWSATPTSVIRASTLSPPPSDSDSQYEGGLATPGPSLSRASTLPTQTPRPPGGWVATPTPRKSVLQVRFDEKPSEVELSATEESANGHPEEQSEVSDTGLVTPVEEQGYFDSRTPEPVAPVSPKSPRRSPTINFVDEYGRHSKPTPKTSPKSTHRSSPKNRKKIRIVDAMGREVKPDASLKSEPAPDLPLTKANALNFVRNEVGDMASKLEEMDLSSDYADLERERIIQLDNESRTARAARHDLEEAYRRHSSAQLRASMLSSKLVSQSHSRSSSPRIWLWTIIIMFQALFIFLLYRYQARKTHELFLTTYYDPFYPDLHHIYGSKYDFFAIPRTVTSIRSLTRTLWEEGLRAFMGSLFETGTLVISEWQRDAWRRWGAEEISWPPT